MIKRMNKVTSLVVAAAAVASLVPVNSVSAATKLETLEGTLENVQAFDGGKYIFDGYKNEDQDSAMYYFNGSKDVEIEDVDGSDEQTKYGKEFINFDNSDETLFNLSTGKVDEDTVSDKIAYMQTKFNSSVIKKADRYDNATLQTITAEDQLNANQFGDVWYGYTTSAAATVYAGYLSADGKYVDTDETANVDHFVKDTNGSFKKLSFDEMDDTVEFEGATYSLSANNALFADAEYIYRTVEVLKDGQAVATYLQKISKAQGEKVDGAYIPKSVASYLITDDFLTKVENAEAVRVIKGSVHVVNFDSNKITIEKFDLVKDRDEDIAGTNRIYKVELDEDYDDVDNEDATDFDIDVDGNVWVLYKGSVQKVVNGKLETKYTVDRTMDNLSVYDDNDVVVWNTEDDIYATVAGTEGEEEVETAKGWVEGSNGAWSFVKADGTKATGWYNDNGTWYYFDSVGNMLTGWQNVNGTWYYLNPVSNGTKGAMQTGWIKDGSTWYYCNASGAMQTGWLKDGSTWYYLQSNGAMKTGWLNDNGTWYYLQSNGAMAANTTIDGYRLGANGAWIR